MSLSTDYTPYADLLNPKMVIEEKSDRDCLSNGRIMNKGEKFVGPYELEFHCDHNTWDCWASSKILDNCKCI